MYLAQEHRILKDAGTSEKGELKRDGANMHFTASEASKKMLMDLISSANDICILYGICDYLGKTKMDDFESRPDSASIVLTPRVSETASLSRASAADNISDFDMLGCLGIDVKVPSTDNPDRLQPGITKKEEGRCGL